MSRAFIQKRLPFKPTDIGGCQQWLDGADATTLTLSGSIVTQWRDKSGSGNNATPVYTGPTLVQNVKNSLPGLSFSGGNIMKCGAFLTSTSFSAFIVVNNNSGTKVSMGVWKVQYGSYIITDTEIKVGTENSSAYSNTSITIPNFTTTHMYAVTLSSSSAPGSSFTYNGSYDGLNTVITGTSSLGNAATCAQEVSIGGLMENNSPQYMMTGYIHEVIFFSNALTSTQRQQVESYLAQKWGLRQQLPQGHPGTRGIVYPSDPVNLLVRLPYPVIFTPLQIQTGSCQLWLDGADPAGTGIVPANGTVLTSWIDKSGKSKNATGVNSPTVVTSGVNSLSVVSYNGSSYSYSSIAAGSFPSGMVIFIVYKVNGAVTYCAPITRTIGNMGYPIDQYNSVRYMGGPGGGSSWSHASATSTTLFSQIILTSGANILSEYVNGTSATVTGAFPYYDTASFIYIGTRDDKVTSFNGYMCEAIVYNAVFTTLQRQQVEGYLAWKWGLQGSLDASNPYKNAPPNTTNALGISRPAGVPIPPITISARPRPVIIISSGLLARYRMNESSGSTVIDSIAGNNITIGGSPSRVSTTYGTYTGFALSIQNATQYGSITLPANMVVGAHSITSWVYFTGFPSGIQTNWLGWGSQCKGETHSFYTDNASIKIIYGGPSCINSLNFLDNNTYTVIPQLNTWYFCATTWDGNTTWKTYCYSPTTAYAFTFSYGMNAVIAGGIFAIGIGNNLNNTFGGTGYGGYLGEIRFYNRVLTAGEVASIFAGTG